ncbi:tyrosine-type recombinase/integrase [Actinokineospora globicatena]|uniref:tyrosine-type recombinase/integrase n=1 Tax=Actinokineospora globicatena TaxID=103729 RepID=UPI0020A5B3E2|nr:site-specific integrase [Actinokineospora globicatena]MCP2306082.1 Site-specific recombinase XerD [Actinokineospora globicatena]GLW80044.1 site-specific integrase [Actinokineospora globicatena]GLW86873.1 site-specific integrase [Actinokineospora globicatena]
MARAWIYDRSESIGYQEQVARAKAAKRKPPGRWMVLHLDKASKQRSRTFATKTSAETYYMALLASIEANTYVDPAAGKVKFAEIAEKWLESRHDLRESTWWKYRGLLDNHVIPRWGDLPVNAIDTEDISVWVAKLLKSSSEGGSGLGPSQARHALRVLSMVLKWCVPKRLPSNPARGVKAPVLPDAEHIYLSYAQVEKLADSAGNLRTKYNQPTASAAVNRALILLLAYTGLRWGEAASLRISRIDLARRRIRVVCTFYEVGGVQKEGPTKTGKSRTVGFPAFLVPILAELIGERPGDELLFLTKRGQSLRANNWRVREFNAAVTAADLAVKGLTPHKLRHTAASLAIAAGADVKVVQLMLGHRDAAMTVNIYGHLWPDRLDEVADVLDERRRSALALAA